VSNRQITNFLMLLTVVQRKRGFQEEAKMLYYKIYITFSALLENLVVLPRTKFVDNSFLFPTVKKVFRIS